MINWIKNKFFAKPNADIARMGNDVLASAIQVLQETLSPQTFQNDLHRLLYIAQLYRVGRDKNIIFSDLFAATGAGPYLSRVNQLHHSAHRAASVLSLTPKDEAILREVAEAFGRLSSAQLIQITQSPKSAWARHYRQPSDVGQFYKGPFIPLTSMIEEYQHLYEHLDLLAA